MAIAFLAFGSNLKDRQKNIEQAQDLLEKNGIVFIKRSGIIETDPQGGPPQGKYLNSVAKVKTELSPEDLLKLIHLTEQNLGRVRTVKNAPRTIDIDILLYDNVHMESPGLTIPHPRMLERQFVLEPLNEIEPGLIEKITNEDT